MSTVALTPKGRAVALLLAVRERWETLTPEQQAECSAILERLAAALRREEVSKPSTLPRPLPLIGRIVA